MSAREQVPAEECEQVLHRVYEFLDHELDDASADSIRQHLVDCEPCMDHFDVEQAVKSLVNRCCGNDLAPEYLRAKVLNRMAQHQGG